MVERDEQRQHVPSSDEVREEESRARERAREETKPEHYEHTQLSPSAVGARLAGSRAPAAQQEA